MFNYAILSFPGRLGYPHPGTDNFLMLNGKSLISNALFSSIADIGNLTHFQTIKHLT